MSSAPEQLPLDAGEAHGHLIRARDDLEEAAVLLARAARHIDAALALQPRDRKGRPLSAAALRLWGAHTATSTAAMHTRRAHTTCTTFLLEESP